MMRLLRLCAASGVVAMSLVVACVGDDPAVPGATDGSCKDPKGCTDGGSASDGGTPDDGGGKADGSDACAAPCKGDVVWLRSFGSATGESISQTIVDGAGNVYIAAYAGAALGLGDDGGAPVVAPGLFVAKFDANGRPQWAKEIGGATQLPKLAAAPGGGLFVAGTYFKNATQTLPITWGGTDTGLGLNVGTSGYDIFILKIDAAGAFVSAEQIGGNGYDEMRAIGVDTDGSPVIFGQMFTAVTYRTQAIPQGPFVLKLASASFDPVWLHAIGTQGSSFVRGSRIMPAAAGDVAVAGEYGGQIDWGDGRGFTGSAAPPIQNNAFVARLKSGGTMTSTESFASIYGDVNAPPSVTSLQGAAFGASPEPAIAVVGRFEGVVGLGGPFLQNGDAGSRDPGTYVARYDATTMKLLAFRGIFDAPTTSAVKQVAVDKDGNISVAGSFKGTLDVGGGALASNGDSDGFVVLYDRQLKTHLWSVHFGGPITDRVVGMGVDPAGAIVVTGEFQGTADFPSGKQLASKGGATNVFLMKLAR
jgi:hypothetical protein